MPFRNVLVMAATRRGLVQKWNNDPLIQFIQMACVRIKSAEMMTEDRRSVRCPYCGELTPSRWYPLYTMTETDLNPRQGIKLPDTNDPLRGVMIEVYWTECVNDECGQIIVRIRHGFYNPQIDPDGRRSEGVDEWWAVPRKGAQRRIDPLVQGHLRRTYLEATTILDGSPRMSAVLSRSLLADLLKQYAGRSERDLGERIRNFLEDDKHPTHVKKNLNRLREMGNFGAHTQIDQATGEVIDVDGIEAEFALDVIDGLFNYFIVAPETSEQIGIAFDRKVEKAGRKPIK